MPQSVASRDSPVLSSPSEEEGLLVPPVQQALTRHLMRVPPRIITSKITFINLVFVPQLLGWGWGGPLREPLKGQ